MLGTEVYMDTDRATQLLFQKMIGNINLVLVHTATFVGEARSCCYATLWMEMPGSIRYWSGKERLAPRESYMCYVRSPRRCTTLASTAPTAYIDSMMRGAGVLPAVSLPILGHYSSYAHTSPFAYSQRAHGAAISIYL